MLKYGSFLYKHDLFIFYNIFETKDFRIKLIAYRPMGVREEYAHYQVPSQEYLGELADILKTYGFKDIVII